MEQLSWLPAHSDLGAAISDARREADPAARLALAVSLAGFRRFNLAGRLDRMAAEGPVNLVADGALPRPGLTPLTDVEVERLACDAASVALALGLRDRFGDINSGQIGRPLMP